MDNPEKSPAVLSLCTGYGGLERGISNAIGKTAVLAHVEIEAFAIANLVDKMETGRMDPAPIWTDLKTVDASLFRNRVDILMGGYPCQPFSAAGKRGGTDDPRHLWPFIGGTVDGRKNIIEQCRPRWVFFENVEGHLSLGIGEVLADLEKMGYRVAVGIFSAAEVGAPHQRKRVFILGRLENAESWENRRLPRGTLAGKPMPGVTGGYAEPVADAEGVPVRGLPGGEEEELPELKQSSFNDVADSGPGRGEQPRAQQSKKFNINSERWPGRPGEPQHDREEPRITNGETEPGLGGAINGSAAWLDKNRVDRLRLLGNGVVPQVAEKAFLTLYKKLTNDL